MSKYHRGTGTHSAPLLSVLPSKGLGGDGGGKTTDRGPLRRRRESGQKLSQDPPATAAPIPLATTMLVRHRAPRRLQKRSVLMCFGLAHIFNFDQVRRRTERNERA